MPSKVDANETDYLMGLNINAQEPGETNADTNATDATMGLNYNAQEPGETNVNDVQNYQHSTAPA